MNPSRYLAASLLVALVVLASCGQDQPSGDPSAAGDQDTEGSQGDAGDEEAYGEDSEKNGQETEGSNGYGSSGSDEGGDSDSGEVGGATQSAAVKIVDTAFKPGTTTVEAGTKVSWKQTGSQPHSVTATDESFDSNPKCSPLKSKDCMGAGDSFSFTFDEPGTYSYYCRVHGLPDGTGMVGKIEVE